jgi:ppGpp synthetase/RelA/SpoT-type nucleotidyltranferase
MSKEKRPSIDDLMEEYRSLIDSYNDACVKSIDIFKGVFDSYKIPLSFPMQYRIKSWDSILAKIGTLKIPVKSIKDIQDIAGVRVILFSFEEAEDVYDISSDYFTVIKRYNTKDRLKSDQFGYSSFHIVVGMETGSGILPVEIQIRTISQHVWAELSKRVSYKQIADSMPYDRDLNRLSALSELLDKEISNILGDHRLMRQSHEEFHKMFIQSNIDESSNLRFVRQDIDNDGQFEVVRQSLDKNQVIEVYTDKEGELLPLHVEHIGSEYEDLSDIVLVDIDNDGLMEIVCTLQTEPMTNIVFYKLIDGEIRVMRKSLVYDGQDDIRFFGFLLGDFNSDGWIEIASKWWISIPNDLLPPKYSPDDYPSGYIEYTWRWNPEIQAFGLISRVLKSVGGR